ncbi:MAG: D-xylose ABC transporter ATP-binding protein [Firmicutes bacterium HGW-Firmicutes-2]|jgi:ribose transport system ATP-binding protein|nr:MAG: D-xylose ABC transporter ATP-binding protein [Firmicutes bacterium HGW-Firmicutes-2]
MVKNVIKMVDIDKRFPGVHALKDCSFELNKGEVHALIGENGAGKSTLMKILTGVYDKNGGAIYYKGKEVEINSPKAAQELGISIIHQELNLMPDLTVAENIYIGREPMRFKGIFCDSLLQNKMAKELLDNMNVKIEPTVKVEQLTVAQQQMIEIAKALSFNSEVLIMDEPTAALTESEIDELFRIIQELKAKGVGIVYISHRMEELKKICDRVTVMRDGEYVGMKNMNEVTIDEIIKMMVGREIYEGVHDLERHQNHEVVLEVKHLTSGKKVKDVSFQLRKGEILGFAGLMGAGRTEVARCLFGADPKDSGEIYINGQKVHIRSPKDAVANGIGYLSEDRKRYGLVLGLDVNTNIAMATMPKFSNRLGFLKEDQEKVNATKYIDTLSIKTPSGKQLVQNLSGGNQQKVVIGKWLTRNCDILIFDEPTRGIDVGAKSEIYKLLNELADQGMSIIMISSELPEVLRMSHRIMVMCEGKITGELSRNIATQERIMTCATDRTA